MATANSTVRAEQRAIHENQSAHDALTPEQRIALLKEENEVLAEAVERLEQRQDSARATADLIRQADALFCNLQPFFDLAEREIAEKNSTDFDNLKFLLKGAKAEVFALSNFIAELEGTAEGGAA